MQEMQGIQQVQDEGEEDGDEGCQDHALDGDGAEGQLGAGQADD